MSLRARKAIFDRLRAATAGPGLPRPAAPVPLRRAGAPAPDFAAFEAALTPLGPTFDLARDAGEAQSALAAVAVRHGVRTAVRWDHPDLAAVEAASALEQAGVVVLPPEDLPARPCPSLATVDMGVTGVEYALCATGSLVLTTAPGRERATALVPRLHVALVAASRLLPDLPALFDRLGDRPLPAAVTCVTGISSTGDIEFVYVRGVHGPLAVHVIGLSWL